MVYETFVRAAPISRLSLRQQVYSSIFRLLIDGRWPENGRLQDSVLASELHVSRTPVREALIQLEAEGLIECDPNRGFFVPPLRPETARDVYPILWSLEQLAVFLAAGSAREVGKKLQESASHATASPDSSGALKQDRAWHAALAEASRNEKLIRLTSRIEALTRRYAAQLKHDPTLFERRAREHAQIAEALTTDQPARAFALLKMHWRAEMESVLQTLDQRGEKPVSAGEGEGYTGWRRTKGASAGRS